MILGDDGKYYLDEEKTVEMTPEIIKSIYKNFEEISFFNITKTKDIIFNKKNFTFKYKNGIIVYIDKNMKENQIQVGSIKVIFRANKEDNIRYIFSVEQFEKNLEIFKITFPWSFDTIVSNKKIEQLIERNDINSSVIVQNIVFDELKDTKKNIPEKFIDLSKYINYYLKDDIDIQNYEENDFLDKNIFTINPESRIQFYSKGSRLLFIQMIMNKFSKGEKEYFFTGLHSTGKTFTLLMINFAKIDKTKIIYFNLETLKTTEKFLEIIIYESQYFFDKIEDWKKAFISLKDKISDVRNCLNIIATLIELFVKEYVKEGINYIIILDQIKFKQIGDNEYENINLIRNMAQKNKNLYLIGCCSINYKGVKDMLFYKWTKLESEIKDKNIPYINYISSSQFNENNCSNKNLNKYLHLLGNTPRFKNIEDKLNSKIVNLFIKKTKKKILKFYNSKGFYEFKIIEKIPVMKKFAVVETFLNELAKIPFKYFNINENDYSIDYSCPIIKKVFEEILEEKKLYTKYNASNNNDSEKGWYFEKRVIFKIRTTNLLPNKYYIDNSYLIDTIFLPCKVNDLDLSENSFFYFKYSNVKRYDCAIYLGKKKEFLLIQISINKPKNKLDEYSENFKSDIDDLQGFITKNDLKVNQYSLLFILDFKNYNIQENLNIIKKSEFSFCCFDLDNNQFIGEIKDVYKIPYEKDPKKEIKLSSTIYEFGKIDYSFDYDYKGKYHKYYVEKNMTLERFFNEIFDEEIKAEFKEKTKINLLQYYFSSFRLDAATAFLKYNTSFKKGTKLLFLNYMEDQIYYGIGKTKSDLEWNLYDVRLRYVNNKLKKNLNNMICLLFVDKKFTYPLISNLLDDRLKKSKK